MTLACIEHVNLTVQDPDKLAALFCQLFDWKVRWSGPAKDNGYTVHVGSDNRYLALYTHDSVTADNHSVFRHGTANHIGLVVDNAGEMEQKILDLGFKTKSHSDYGACRSFYFMADECLEIEIVYYPKAQ